MSQLLVSEALCFGLRAILIQAQQSTAYFSYGLSAKEQLQPNYEHDMMAMVVREVTMVYCRRLNMLQGHEFVVVYKLAIEHKDAHMVFKFVQDIKPANFTLWLALPICMMTHIYTEIGGLRRTWYCVKHETR